MKVLIIFLFVFSPLYAYEIQGKLENISAETTIKEADAFIAKLILWPYEAKDEESFYDLEGRDILDFFLVSRVSKVQRSENNNQALEVYLTLVLKKFFVKNDFYIFNYKDLNIPVELVGITPERRQLVTKDFFIKEQEKTHHKSNLIYLIGILVVILMLGFYFSIKKKKVKIKSKVFHLDNTIASRDCFEDLYKNREDLLFTFKDKETEISKLLKEIDKIQYKPEWNEEELKRIQESFQKIFNNSEEAP